MPAHLSTSSQRASSVEDIQQTFELLESLYWVLQELGFPFPARFREKLLSTGYACLPRSVFVSYVEAGILVLNKVSWPRGWQDFPMKKKNFSLSKWAFL